MWDAKVTSPRGGPWLAGIQRRSSFLSSVQCGFHLCPAFLCDFLQRGARVPSPTRNPKVYPPPLHACFPEHCSFSSASAHTNFPEPLGLRQDEGPKHEHKSQLYTDTTVQTSPSRVSIPAKASLGAWIIAEDSSIIKS